MDRGVPIAAVRDKTGFLAALSSPVETIFLLDADLLSLPAYIHKAHEAGKTAMVHIDMARGIGKDREGVAYLQRKGADGVISTRGNLVRFAKEIGLVTVQRFFMVDSQSVSVALESAKTHRPDYVEIMPGVVFQTIRKCAQFLDVPVIAGGLLESVREAEQAAGAGAYTISTSKQALWQIRLPSQAEL